MNARDLSTRLALSALVLAGVAAPAAAAETLRHDLRVALDPAAHEIRVFDRITLPAELFENDAADLRFVLHGDLRILDGATGFEIEPLGDPPDSTRYGINEADPDAGGPPLVEYRLRPLEPAGNERILELSYQGKIYHPLVSEGEEYARSFSRTAGIISDEGVVLSASSWWLPTFGRRLVSFEMSVELPAAWDAVSQGGRTLHEIRDGRRHVTWDSPQPMDEVYLIAARFVEYSRPAGNVTAYAFLREAEPNLASKYLEASVQYIEMYRKMIGTYPYDKFALVENFWDTGYGMPSFTLLGSTVIRLPFILHSSYPHEILHNWWGNSVFVDYETGNWCEGLTAYLADHLTKEGQGQGIAYRRDTLKRYRNYVRGEEDFPLHEFRSRHDSATEAVGYGKSLMLWHMLRRQLGDEGFLDGLRRFYRTNRFRRASFDDLRKAFADTSGQNLDGMFAQWVDRTGAPQLELGETTTSASGANTVLTIEIRQVQGGDPYMLSVPVAITLDGEDEAGEYTLDLSEDSGTLRVVLPAEPRRIDVDPGFDLFRRLDPYEIPTSVGQLFGADQVMIVLPSETGAVGFEDWEAFAKTWSGEAVQVVRDNDIDRFPSDRAVWLLGTRNRFAPTVASALERFDAGADVSTVRAGGQALPGDDHCFAFAIRHPDDASLAVGWIGAETPAALPGLARKLPHYGKYSYVAFSGDEPTNVAKGQWPVLASPLVRFLGDDPVEAASLQGREPLARPEPVFDPERLIGHVRHLASVELEGRGVGTPGLSETAEYIAKAFEDAGLEPGGDAGDWFQTWTEPDGPDGKPVTVRNVIGVLPGLEPEWREQSVVLGAHYDHLGRGWPDVRSGDEGQIHPGADDNASGVAVLLELAKLLGRELQPDRTLVFAAFTAEEWDLRGSRHYVETMKRWPVDQAMAMINLDTVGRLGEKKLTVFGTGTATEWIHIVRGVGFTTGIQADAVTDDPGGSDQRSFVAAGLPAVQIFSGAHEDYHRPSDSVDAIDTAGLVKVATFVREALVYLSERENPLTSTLSPSAVASGPARSSSGRRVSLGTLPDFAFAGPGVKISQVMSGTPAEAAGLKAGDLLVAIDDDDIADVRGYSNILRTHEPGDTIRLRVVRAGEEIVIEAKLVAR